MKNKPLIYQVLPRLFGNTSGQNRMHGSIEENGCGKLNFFTDKALQAIHSMGFTHVWYTGLLEHATQTDYSRYGIARDHKAVVKGVAGSPYAIKDYYDIDPDLACNPTQRMQEFEALVARTHANKLKMIIDFVPNHVARSYASDAKPEGVADFGANDDTTQRFHPNNNFYYIPNERFCAQIDLFGGEEAPYYEYPAKATGNDRFDAFPTTNDWYETVKLNYGLNYDNWRQGHFSPIPDTWFKMLDILLFWASKKVDGFRCDMAEMVPVEFWGWVIPQVKIKYPAVQFIAEVYNIQEYRNYIFTGKFDYLYDKEGLYNILRAVMTSYTPAFHLSNAWKMVDGIQEHMLSFLENHDEQRLASDFFAGDATKAIPGMVVCATLSRGPVMVYAGQELGERGMDQEGFSGLDGRTTIFDYWKLASLAQWAHDGNYDGSKLSSEQLELQGFYSKLMHLAGTEKSVVEGQFYDIMYVNEANRTLNGKQYAYLRYHEGEYLLVATNFSNAEIAAEFYLPLHFFEFLQLPLVTLTRFRDLLSDECFEQAFSASEPFRVTLPAWGARILKFTL